MAKIRFIFIIFITILLAGVIFNFLKPTQAGDPSYGLNETAKTAEIPITENPNPFPEMIGSIIGWALGILGSIFLVIIIIGGYLWMMAAGNEEKVRKAKMLIGAALSGIFIIFVSYAVAGAIINALIQASKEVVQ